MAQLDQTTNSVNGSTLTGLLSSFKNSVGLRSSSGGMFATLLSETEPSLPQVETKGASSQESKRPEPSRDTQRTGVDVAHETSSHIDSRDGGRAAADDRRNDKAQAVSSQEKAKDQNRAQQDAQTKINEPAPATEGKKQAEKGTDSNVSVQNDQGQMQESSAKADDMSEDQDMAALMATLLPLAEAVATTVDGNETAGATKETTNGDDQQTTVDPNAMALTTLQAAAGQMSNDNAQTKTKSASSHDEKKANVALQPLAAQTAPQGEIATVGTDALATSEGRAKLADVKEEKTNLYSKMVDESSSFSQEAGHSGGQGKAQDFYTLMRGNGQNQTGSGVQAVSAAVTAQSQSSSQTASETVGVQGGAGAKAASVLSPTGEGVRPAGSYDFASQLSAARVTKGGAAGLPQAVEQVSVQLNKAAKDGVDEITIQLRPAELGKIEIKLEFGADKSVTGTVVAESQATLNLLQKDSASLHRALQDAGLQADAGCMQFSLRDDNNASQFANQNQNESGRRSSFSNDTSSDDVALAASASDTETYYISPGRVNLRV